MRSRIAVRVTASDRGATEFHLGRRTRTEGARKKAKGKVGRKKEKLRKDEDGTRLSGRRVQNFWEIRIIEEGRNCMKILTITAIIALPLMALGQTTEPQQTQEQTKETQATAPAKGKKMGPGQEASKPQAKPETGTNMRGQTNVQGRNQGTTRTETGMRSSTGQTTKVN